MKQSIWIGLSALLVSTIACEPVFAIGWREILLVMVLAAFLIGPPVYRFIRKIENILRQKNK